MIALAALGSLLAGTVPDMTMTYSTSKDVVVESDTISDSAPNLTISDGTTIQVMAPLGLCTIFVDWGNGIYAQVTVRADSEVIFKDDPATLGYDIEIVKGSIVIDEYNSSASAPETPGSGTVPLGNRLRPKKRSVVLGGVGTSYLVTSTATSVSCAVLTGTVEMKSGEKTVTVAEGKAQTVPDAGWMTAPTPRSISKFESMTIKEHLSNASTVRLDN